eukprot:6719460-Prymnesium_polylepis.1
MRTKKDRCRKEGWGNGGTRTQQASERNGTGGTRWIIHHADPPRIASWMRGEYTAWNMRILRYHTRGNSEHTVT